MTKMHWDAITLTDSWELIVLLAGIPIGGVLTMTAAIAEFVTYYLIVSQITAFEENTLCLHNPLHRTCLGYCGSCDSESYLHEYCETSCGDCDCTSGSLNNVCYPYCGLCDCT